MPEQDRLEVGFHSYVRRSDPAQFRGDNCPQGAQRQVDDNCETQPGVILEPNADDLQQRGSHHVARLRAIAFKEMLYPAKVLKPRPYATKEASAKRGSVMVTWEYSPCVR